MNPSATDIGRCDSVTGLQMTPSWGQAWKSHSRFPHL